MRGVIQVLVLAFALTPPLSGQRPAGPAGLGSACGEGVHLLVEGLPETSFVSAEAGLAYRSLSDSAEIWGQHVKVLGAVSGLVRDTVVLVRWRPSPDAPVMWLDDSQPLFEAGQPVFVTGSLRANERSDGLPIVDVLWGIHWGGDDPRSLPVDSVLAFCSLTVDRDLVSAGDWAGMADVLAWVRSSPGGWTRQPVAFHLQHWASAIEEGRVRSIPVAVAGTWEAEAELPSGESVRFFFRTATGAYWPWTGLDRDAYRDVPEAPWASRASGVLFRVWAALSMDDLPGPSGPPQVPCRREGLSWWSGSSEPTNEDCVEGSASAIVEPLGSDVEAWQGLFPPDVLGAVHPALAALDEAEDLRTAATPRGPRDFWVFPGAGSRSMFVQRIGLRGGEVVLTARRISPMAVAGN